MHMHIFDRETERSQSGCRAEEGKADLPLSREPENRVDAKTLGSWVELKAASELIGTIHDTIFDFWIRPSSRREPLLCHCSQMQGKWILAWAGVAWAIWPASRAGIVCPLEVSDLAMYKLHSHAYLGKENSSIDSFCRGNETMSCCSMLLWMVMWVLLASESGSLFLLPDEGRF